MDPIDANMTDVSRANTSVKDALLAAFTRLQAQLATTEPILMYIDEAHELTWRSPTHETDTLADLSRVLALIVDLPFSVVFLSTNSWLAALAPRPSDFPSRRDWSKTYLHAPWTELPFDCRASGAFKAINMTGQAASLQQLFWAPPVSVQIQTLIYSCLGGVVYMKNQLLQTGLFFSPM
ncbi:hypothetical protein B0H10DRAFT_206603 [Mycena sp. CBHHK59/15]|nr:hypothetical protein B0H10DRAFT_206603 [Mycena sp. CBHHK59/15]